MQTIILQKIPKILTNNYLFLHLACGLNRPQWKVMFSQVSVCQRGEGSPLDRDPPLNREPLPPWEETPCGQRPPVD